MKKLIILGLCVLFLVGCTRIPTLQNGEDAVVTFGNGNMLSVDEFYQRIKDTFGLQTLIEMIDKAILEEVYKNDLEDAREDAENYVHAWQTHFGEEALMRMQQEYGYSTWEAFEDFLYLSQLQSKAIEDFAKGKITDRQIENYYRDEIVGDIKVSHILITPEVTGTMDREEVEAAEAGAKEKAENLIKELRDVSANEVADKFAELAKVHSDDKASGAGGGNIGFINKHTLDDAYGEFATEAYKLRDGQFTTRVVQSELGFHIILRVESKEKPALDTVRDTIIESLSSNLLDEDATVPIRAMQELRKEHGVELIDSELQQQYASFMQNALTNAERRNRENE